MEKFILLNESLKALKKNSINLLIIKGEAGMGKTKTTLNFLKQNKVNFNYFSSYTTPLYFYKLLYENRNKEVLVFDDIEGINNLKIIAMLKSLCWNNDEGKRKVFYFSTSEKLKEHNLPNKIKTDAKIILIFNNNLFMFKPIINRGILIDFNFTFKEKLKIFEKIQKKAEIDKEVLNYVKSNCDEGTGNLNIRSLVILSKLKKDGFDFHIFAKEILKTDKDIGILLNLVQKCNSAKDFKIKDAVEEWIKLTGKSRRTFFNLKKKFDF